MLYSAYRSSSSSLSLSLSVLLYVCVLLCVCCVTAAVVSVCADDSCACCADSDDRSELPAGVNKSHAHRTLMAHKFKRFGNSINFFKEKYG